MAFPSQGHRANWLVDCNLSQYNGNVYNSIDNSSSELQLLWNKTAPGAAYDSEERYPAPRCLPHTRVEALNTIQDWISDQSGSEMLWLHGPAGSGKSAVAQTICETLANQKQLLASFFFSRNSPTRSQLERFVPTIAFQASAVTRQTDCLLNLIKQDPRVLNQRFDIQFHVLFVELIYLLQNLGGGIEIPIFIVIDGLDECDGNDNQIRLLALFSTLLKSQSRPPFRVLLVSRPEPHIRHAIEGLPQGACNIISLYGDEGDVFRYFQHSFSELRASEKHHDIRSPLDQSWPGETVIWTLTTRSGGYFIYATTVVKFIDEDGYVPQDRLREILNYRQESFTMDLQPYQELDKVYSQILSTAKNYKLVARILGFLIADAAYDFKVAGYYQYSRASARELAQDTSNGNSRYAAIITRLWHLRPGLLSTALRGLHSVVDVTGNLGFYHASLSDFLSDEARSGPYYIDRQQALNDIFAASLNLFFQPQMSEEFSVWISVVSIWNEVPNTEERLRAYLQARDHAYLAHNVMITLGEMKLESRRHALTVLTLLGTMMLFLRARPLQVLISPTSGYVKQGKVKGPTPLSVSEDPALMSIRRAFCNGSLMAISGSNTPQGLQCLQNVKAIIDLIAPWQSMEIPRAMLAEVGTILHLRWDSTECIAVSNMLHFLASGYPEERREIFDLFFNDPEVWKDQCKPCQRKENLLRRLSTSMCWTRCQTETYIWQGGSEEHVREVQRLHDLMVQAMREDAEYVKLAEDLGLLGVLGWEAGVERYPDRLLYSPFH